MEITTTIATTLASGPGAASAVAPTPVADSLAAQQFADMMRADAPMAPVVPLPAAAADPAVAGGPRSLGDSILNGMQNLSTDFQQSWRTVQAALDGGVQMTMSDMLKLQMGVVQMSVQYDMVGKAISRSTQNIDQLVKMQ